MPTTCLLVVLLALPWATSLAVPVQEENPASRIDDQALERILGEMRSIQEDGRRQPENPVAATDNAILAGFVRSLVGEVGGTDGNWNFDVGEVSLMLVTDEAADRMRLITPVGEAQSLEPAQLLTLLEANFDRALDAKYAVWRGLVWSTFVHPLSSLGRDEFENAVRQVLSLYHNYGTSYSSTGFVFGEEEPDAQP